MTLEAVKVSAGDIEKLIAKLRMQDIKREWKWTLLTLKQPLKPSVELVTNYQNPMSKIGKGSLFLVFEIEIWDLALKIYDLPLVIAHKLFQPPNRAYPQRIQDTIF
uniref:Uncharacterized protein n=1 Tax=Candidatus Methanophaga sp. ANME-1 ERB7 TaxID=2759913 RepID=A0A7G9Z899_9EURY|nr:hypothetical protein LPLLKDDP_00015 [Methanosarcinales archaeon ANME-1 ERB7]